MLTLDDNGCRAAAAADAADAADAPMPGTLHGTLGNWIPVLDGDRESRWCDTSARTLRSDVCSQRQR